MHIRGGGKSSIFGSEGWNIAKSDILGPNKTDTMFMIFLTSNIVELIFLGSLEWYSGQLEAVVTSICILLLILCSCTGSYSV